MTPTYEYPYYVTELRHGLRTLKGLASIFKIRRFTIRVNPLHP